MPGRNGSKGEIEEPGEPGTMVGTKMLVYILLSLAKWNSI